MLPKIVEEVPKRIEQKKRMSKHYYDRKIGVLPKQEIGQPVAVQLNVEKNKLWSKGTISEKFSDRSYVIDIDGAKYC